MSVSHNLNLPFVEAAQAQKHVTVNEAIEAIDAILHLSVLARDVVDPPADAAEGARYLVGAGATGAWAGHDGDLAILRNGGWTFMTPRVGWTAYDAGEDSLHVLAETGWRPIGGGDADPTVALGLALEGTTLTVVADGGADAVDLSGLATTDAGALVTGTLSGDRLPASVSGRSLLDVPLQTFANATFGGAGLSISVADDGRAYLAGGTAPGVFDEAARLGWDPASAAWRFEGEATADGFGVGGASPDATNRLAVSSEAALFTHAGGDVRVSLNKAGETDTASFVFQSGWSGRAEFGLAGEDAFSVKVSADGAVWRTALAVDPASGEVALPAGLAVSGEAVLTASDAAAFATAAEGALAASAVQPGDLAAVATSGAYADLAGLPGLATPSADGLMAAADKAKLDGIGSGATSDLTAAEIAALIDADAGAEQRLRDALGVDSAVVVSSHARRIPAAADLAATDVASATAVVVADGYHAAGDGGAALWKRVPAEPSHPGKIRSVDRFLPDQTEDATNGGWWELVADRPDPRMFGARCDARFVTDAAMTAGGATVTSATAAFTADDVGKVVLIRGAGEDEAGLQGIIKAVNSATEAVVGERDFSAAPASLADKAASFTVSGVKMAIASDDTEAFRHAWDYVLDKGMRVVGLGAATYYIARPEEFEMHNNDFLAVPQGTVANVGIVGVGKFASKVFYDPLVRTDGRTAFFGGVGFTTGNRAFGVEFRDFTFEGALEYHTDGGAVDPSPVERAINSCQFATVKSIDWFEMTGCRVMNVPGAALWVSFCQHVTIEQNVLFRCRDGIITFGNEWVSVSHNQIYFATDDAIAISPDDPWIMLEGLGGDPATDIRVPQVQGVIHGNRLFACDTGIKTMACRGVSVTGNTMAYMRRFAFHIKLLDNDDTDAAQATLASLSITGNTVLNQLSREVDPAASSEAAVWIVSRDDGQLFGGDRDPADDSIVDFYESTDAYGHPDVPGRATGPMYAVVFANNTFARTAAGATNWSDYGFDYLLNHKNLGVEWNPEITDSDMRPPVFRVTAGRLRGVRIEGCSFFGLGPWLSLSTNAPDTVAKINGMVIRNCTFEDVRGARWTAGDLAPGSVDLTVENCLFDGDPFHLVTGRNADGSWASDDDLQFVGMQGGAGLPPGFRFIRNTFRNWSSPFESPREEDRYHVEDNIIEYEPGADPPDFSTSNKGVGRCPRLGAGFRARIVRSDPTQDDYGTVLNDCALARTAMPDSGIWVKGHRVWNTTWNGEPDVPMGWLRLTTGSGNAIGVDWQPIHVLDGTIGAASDVSASLALADGVPARVSASTGLAIAIAARPWLADAAVIADFKYGAYAIADENGVLCPCPFETVVNFTGEGGTRTYVDRDGELLEAAAGEPRIEYDASGVRVGIRRDPASENVLDWSEAFGGSSDWSASNLALADSGSGYWTLTESDDAGTPATHALTGAAFTPTAGVPWTFYVDVARPATNGRDVVVALPDAAFPADATATADLSAGTVVAGAGADRATIEPLGAGVYRVAVTATADAAASGTPTVTLSDGTGTSYAGDGTGIVHLYRAQLEQTIQPTAYIPTAGAPVARADETLGLERIADWFRQPVGCLVFRGRWLIDDPGGGWLTALNMESAGGANHVRIINSGEETEIRLRFRSSGNTYQDLVSTGYVPTQTQTIAIAWNRGVIRFAHAGAVMPEVSHPAMEGVDYITLLNAGGLCEFVAFLRRYPSEAELTDIVGVGGGSP